MAKTFIARVWDNLTSPFSRKQFWLGLTASLAPHAAAAAADAICNAVHTPTAGAKPGAASSISSHSGGSAKAGVSSHLDSGQSVVGTPFDSLKPLSSFSDASAKRYGYMGSDGYWTERGYNRATSADWDQFQTAHDAFKQSEDD